MKEERETQRERENILMKASFVLDFPSIRRFCFLWEVSLSPGEAGVVSGEFEVIFLHPNVEVVVLPSPSPELVGEPVHLSELGHRYR